MTSALGCMNVSISRGLVLCAVLVLLMAAQVLTATSTYADGAEPSALNNPTDAPANIYDDIQPGADDPRVKEGFAAYQAGDFKKAYDIWLPLAEAGNAEAQFRIGRLYSLGDGFPRKGSKAIKCYKLAAIQGHLRANTNLGIVYDTGEIVPKNTEKAIRYHIYAAERGYVEAQQGLAIAYATADRNSRDIAEAYKWLFIAIENGRMASKSTLLKLDQFGSPADRKEGNRRMREWLESHACK